MYRRGEEIMAGNFARMTQ